MVDYFGCELKDFVQKKLFLLDMDGTIYEEETVFDGTYQLLDYIDSMGGKYVFITNNSSKSVNDYVEKLSRLGIKGNHDNFFTSTQAAVFYLKKIIH